MAVREARRQKNSWVEGSPNVMSSQAPSAGRYLNFTTKQLAALITFMKANFTSDRGLLHAETRPLQPQNASVAVKVPEVTPKMLALGAPKVDFAEFKPAYQQLPGGLPGTLAVLKLLVGDPRFSKLADQAINEVRLLQGEGVVNA